MKKSEVIKGRRVKYQPFPNFLGATVVISSDLVNWYQVPGLRPTTSEGHVGVLARRLSAEGEPLNATFVAALHTLFLIDGDENPAP